MQRSLKLSPSILIRLHNRLTGSKSAIKVIHVSSRSNGREDKRELKLKRAQLNQKYFEIQQTVHK